MVTRTATVMAIKCFLCKSPALAREDKYGRPFFICRECGLACFSGKRQATQERFKQLTYEAQSEVGYE